MEQICTGIQAHSNYECWYKSCYVNRVLNSEVFYVLDPLPSFVDSNECLF